MDSTNTSYLTSSDYLAILSDNIDDSSLDEASCWSTLNFTNTPDAIVADLMLYPPNVRFLISIILPVILIFGLVTNLSFLFTVLRVQSMRTITNAYLANLSIADSCFTFIIGFRYIWTIANSPDVYTNPFEKDEGCVFMTFATFLPYFTSIILVSLVSYERYLATCHPLRHRVFNSKKRAGKLICATWVVACLLAASITPTGSLTRITCVYWPTGKQYLDLPTTLYSCVSVSPMFWNYAYLLQAGCFLLAFGTNTLFYAFISNTLLRRRGVGQDKHNIHSQMVNKIQTVNTQVVRMLVINATAFFVCLTPYQFTGLQRVFENLSDGRLDLLTKDQTSTLFWIATTMNCVNSAINPIIYNVVNPRYKRALVEAFRFSKRKHRKDSQKANSIGMISLKKPG